MNNLNLKATPSTPEINFDSTSGKLEILGKSLPEDVMEFYKQIFEWIEDFLKSKPNKLVIIFHLIYFNTASAKAIVDILFKVKNGKTADTKCDIIWKYDEEDDDMKDVAERFEEITGLPITHELA